MVAFTISKKKFDDKYAKTLQLEKSLVPVDGKYITGISLRNKKGEPRNAGNYYYRTRNN